MSQHVTIRLAQRTDYPDLDRLGRLVQADHAAAHPEIFRTGTTAAAVELSVFEFNANAIGFYEHLGFTTLRRPMTVPVDPAVDQGESGQE